MGLLDGISAEDVAKAVEQISRDVSDFAPPGVQQIAKLLELGSSLVAKLLSAQDAGAPASALEAAIDQAMVAAENEHAKETLSP